MSVHCTTNTHKQKGERKNLLTKLRNDENIRGAHTHGKLAELYFNEGTTAANVGRKSREKIAFCRPSRRQLNVDKCVIVS